MESLYVILFSNGHIKVGRSYAPADRMNQHAARVSCFGVKVEGDFSVECADGRGPTREARLIARCTADATARHASEWFDGLDFDVVCEWATECAGTMLFHPEDHAGHLREYLQMPGAMSVAQIREAMNALGCDLKNDAQIRQWIAVDAEGNFKRQPGAAYAMSLERATNGAVMRQAMRPDDYAAIWPELAPPKPAAKRKPIPAPAHV